MLFHRPHKKVAILWNRWIAIQFAPEWFQRGHHLELWRSFETPHGQIRGPLLDLYRGPVTISIGNHPALTDERTKLRHSCRGFFIGKYPEEAIL